MKKGTRRKVNKANNKLTKTKRLVRKKKGRRRPDGLPPLFLPPSVLLTFADILLHAFVPSGFHVPQVAVTPESHRVNAPGVIEMTKAGDGTYE